MFIIIIISIIVVVVASHNLIYLTYFAFVNSSMQCLFLQSATKTFLQSV